MKAFRKVINVFFWIIFIGGLLFLTVLLVGGAFPLNINPTAQKVRFDVARIGWEINDPLNGTFEIVRGGDNVKEGWGALKYDYRYKKGVNPGFHSTAYGIEGLLFMDFYMKSKNPTVWQIQIKRKSDSMIFHKTINVGKNWTRYHISVYDFKNETGWDGKFERADFQEWINFLDISRVKGDKNAVWIDDLMYTR